MKKFALLALFVFWSPVYVYGQACQACTSVPEYPSDFCYEDPRFPNHCVSFSEKQAYYLFFHGKKRKDIPRGDHQAFSYQLELSRNKKLRLSAAHMLFLQQAFAAWELKWRTLGYTFTDSGLGIKVVRAGTGAKPKANEEVRVHYAGYLVDGTPFDSSYDRNDPIAFPVGTGAVIKGWDEGIMALQKGTEAWLYIPADLAYGKQARGAIPANATLIFKIEILE